MRFEDAYEGWTSTRLTQINAAQLLGVCPRQARGPRPGPGLGCKTRATGRGHRGSPGEFERTGRSAWRLRPFNCSACASPLAPHILIPPHWAGDRFCPSARSAEPHTPSWRPPGSRGLPAGCPGPSPHHRAGFEGARRVSKAVAIRKRHLIPSHQLLGVAITRELSALRPPVELKALT